MVFVAPRNSHLRMGTVTALGSENAGARGSILVLDSKGHVEEYEVGPIALNDTTRTWRRGFIGQLSRPISPPGEVVAAHLEYLPTLAGAAAVACKRGQVGAELTIVRGGRPLQTLCRGYIAEDEPLGLGEVHELGPGGGEGFIRTVTGADPAAGAEALDAVPTNALWKLLSYSIKIVTSADAANRVPSLVGDDGAITNRRFFHRLSGTTTATLTRTYLWGIGNHTRDTTVDGPTDTDVLFVGMVLPPGGYHLSEGARLRTSTEQIQAADNYAAPIFQVEEWIKS